MYEAGVVVSRFRNIAHVRMPDRRIRMVCTVDYAPAAIRSRLVPDAWRALDLRVGDELVFDHERVSVRGRTEAVLRDPEVQLDAGAMRLHTGWIPILMSMWRDLHSHSLSRSQSESHERLLVHRLRERTSGLPARAAVDGLLGLGHGLTPSGDDILLGYTLVEFVVSSRASEAVVGRYLRTAAWSRTTEFSASLLEAASHGQVAADLSRLFGLFASEPCGDAIDSVRNYVEATGHYSGRDTAYGIARGMQVWACEDDRRSTA